MKLEQREISEPAASSFVKWQSFVATPDAAAANVITNFAYNSSNYCCSLTGYTLSPKGNESILVASVHMNSII